MKIAYTLTAAVAASTSAFAPSRMASKPSGLQMAEEQFDQEKFIAESKEMRLKHLEEQAMFSLKIACENYEGAVFPNAMIAGDVDKHDYGRYDNVEYDDKYGQFDNDANDENDDDVDVEDKNIIVTMMVMMLSITLVICMHRCFSCCRRVQRHVRSSAIAAQHDNV